MAAAAGLCSLVMAAHAAVLNGFGNLGSLLETFLPWLGVSVPVLLVLAAVRRSAVAGLLPALVWWSLFGDVLVDKRAAGGDLTVVSHNVNDANPDPAGTARHLAASGAQVLALEELSPDTTPTYERVLADSYPYHAVRGTVGLWSRHPLHDVAPVEIMPWPRALRGTVATAKGPIVVYVAHLASVRVRPCAGFATAGRNAAAERLAAAVRAEPAPRVLVVGDFNGTPNDRALAPVFAPLRSAQEEAGAGFGFSWPAALPVARIDQHPAAGHHPGLRRGPCRGRAATTCRSRPPCDCDRLPWPGHQQGHPPAQPPGHQQRAATSTTPPTIVLARCPWTRSDPPTGPYPRSRTSRLGSTFRRCDATRA